MFRVSGGKIVEHQRAGYDPTDFLSRPGVPDLPMNANARTFTVLHRNAARGALGWPGAFSEAVLALAAATDRQVVVILVIPFRVVDGIMKAWQRYFTHR